ncbi:MAG: hypothetical protein ACXVCP_06575 [Bdellovibrio sp.]
MKTLVPAILLTVSLCANLTFAQEFNTSTLNNPSNSSKSNALNLKKQYVQTILDLQKTNLSVREFPAEKLETYLLKIQGRNKNLNLKLNAQGGVDSGGGTFINVKQNLGLLDLYLYNQKAFFDQTKGASALPETKAYQKVGFDRLITNQIPLLQKTLAQIQKWIPSSPIMAPRISEALAGLPIYYTQYKIHGNHLNYYLPTNINIDSSNLTLGAYYLNGFGVFIEKNIFDQISESNQMALLIHEALRHFQISLSSAISNDVVQKLTAKIMTNPQPLETLDTYEFMSGPILDNVLQKRILTLKSYRIVKSACAHGITEFCSLVEMTGPFGNEFVEAINNALNTYNKRKFTENQNTGATESYFWDALNLADDLITQNVGDGLDDVKQSAFQLNRAIKSYSFIDMSLDDFNTNNTFFSLDGRYASKNLYQVRDNLIEKGFFY